MQPEIAPDGATAHADLPPSESSEVFAITPHEAFVMLRRDLLSFSQHCRTQDDKPRSLQAWRSALQAHVASPQREAFDRVPTPAPVVAGADENKTPAIVAVRRAMWEYANRDLSVDQAGALWAECVALLPSRSCIREINSQETLRDRGSLDTSPRESLLDAIARAVAGVGWPANGASTDTHEAFRFLFRKGLALRGYTPVSDDAEEQRDLHQADHVPAVEPRRP